MTRATSVDKTLPEQAGCRASCRIVKGVTGAKCPRPVNTTQLPKTTIEQTPQPVRPLVQIGPLDV